MMPSRWSGQTLINTTLCCINNWKASCVLLYDLLERYFAGVEAAVDQLPVYTESYVEEILTAERVNLRMRLRFQRGGLLEINEASLLKMAYLKRWGIATICRMQITG
jgi:hypothetical protein